MNLYISKGLEKIALSVPLMQRAALLADNQANYFKRYLKSFRSGKIMEPPQRIAHVWDDVIPKGKKAVKKATQNIFDERRRLAGQMLAEVPRREGSTGHITTSQLFKRTSQPQSRFERKLQRLRSEGYDV